MKPGSAVSENDIVAVIDAVDGAPLVQLRGAAVAYGSVCALAPIDFDVCRGEVIALVGANGSGGSSNSSWRRHRRELWSAAMSRTTC